MLDLVDALGELLEPGPYNPAGVSDAIVGSSGIVLDRTGAQPFTYESGWLYGWEESDIRALEESYDVDGGSTERQNFSILFVLVLGGDGENAEGRRKRAVSDALDAKRADYMRAVRENRVRNADVFGLHGWDHVQATADADVARQLAVRGIGVRITGWRFVS